MKAFQIFIFCTLFRHWNSSCTIRHCQEQEAIGTSKRLQNALKEALFERSGLGKGPPAILCSLDPSSQPHNIESFRNLPKTVETIISDTRLFKFYWRAQCNPVSDRLNHFADFLGRFHTSHEGRGLQILYISFEMRFKCCIFCYCHISLKGDNLCTQTGFRRFFFQRRNMQQCVTLLLYLKRG